MGIRIARPRFNVPGGLSASMQLPPPFEFVGVTIRAFPLRAKLHMLRRFCDGYVNVIPEEAGVFVPFIPYVYLLVVNYGRMAVEAQNLGWLSQHEIVFAIPVEWYRREGGRLVFHDWAFISPFIFVDNELSMTTGRQVYGWPKTMVWLDPQLSGWMESPRMPVRLATISAMVFSDAFSGQEQTPRVLLELSHDRSFGRVTPVGAAADGAAIARDLGAAMRELGMLYESPGEAVDNIALRLGKAASMLSPFDGKMSFNAVNLKQFRSSGNAELACYQAVTNSTMDLRRVNGGGLLGDASTLLGDPSGGYDVILRRYETIPIVENLGLEVDSQWRGDGVNVARLKPVFPFWVDVDVRYGLGDTLAFRTMMQGWTDQHGHPFEEKRLGLGGKPEQPRYIGISGASQEIAGPFQMPKTTMRVLPLLASRARMQEVLDDIVNRALLCRDHDKRPLTDDERELVVWGEHVYLVISNHAEVASDANNLGWWADRDVSFYVPVKWYRDGKLVSLALFPVFSYANTATAAITGSEVSGIPMLKVEIDSPPSTWLDDSGPSGECNQPLVQMSSIVFPSSDGAGLGARTRAIIEVREGQIYERHAKAEWAQIAETWGRTLKASLQRARRKGTAEVLEHGRTMALEILTNSRPINIVTMKQFRDVKDPATACYQSLVVIERKVEQIFDMREVETPLYVSIFDYASQPIVTTLGLVTKAVRQVEGGRAHMVEPVRPFWVEVSMREELGETIQSRAGITSWEMIESPYGHHGYFDRQDMNRASRGRRVVQPSPHGAAAAAPDVPGRRLGPSLDHEIQESVPLDLRWKAQEWQLGHKQPLGFEDAIAAVEQLDPHIILGSILSREWENRGKTRWQSARRDLERRLDEATHGLLPHAIPERVMELLDASIHHAQMFLDYPGTVQRNYVRTTERWELDKIGVLRDALDRASSTLSHLEHAAYLLRMANDPEESDEARSLFARLALHVFTSDDILELLLQAVASAGVRVSGLGTHLEKGHEGLRAEDVTPAEGRALATLARDLGFRLDEAVLGQASRRAAVVGLDLKKMLSTLGAMPVGADGTRLVGFEDLARAAAEGGLDLERLNLAAIAESLFAADVDVRPILAWVRDAKVDEQRFDLHAMLLRWIAPLDVEELVGFLGSTPPEDVAVITFGIGALLESADTPIVALPLADRAWSRTLAMFGIDTVGALQRALPMAILDGRVRRGRDNDEIAEVLRKSSAAAVTLAEGAYREALDRVLIWLCRAEEKPDFCVRCDTVLTEVQQRLFPNDERWREDWYVGPDAEGEGQRESKPRIR
jgi:hypothetical protein